jgi:glucose-1-phosphate thymidylyltransferase
MPGISWSCLVQALNGTYELTYEIQDEAGGIAQALGLGEGFADDEDVVVILGDNIFQDIIREDVAGFKGGSRIFLKVPDANRFGVAELDGDKVLGIEEKPEVPRSNFAVTGLYMYDVKVFNVIKALRPSGRGELEITDVNNYYIEQGRMGYRVLDRYWSDAGTFERLWWNYTVRIGKNYIKSEIIESN